MRRVFESGGTLYRVCSNPHKRLTEVFHASSIDEFYNLEKDQFSDTNLILGPWRIKPGGLSVDDNLI